MQEITQEREPLFLPGIASDRETIIGGPLFGEDEDGWGVTLTHWLKEKREILIVPVLVMLAASVLFLSYFTEKSGVWNGTNLLATGREFVETLSSGSRESSSPGPALSDIAIPFPTINGIGGSESSVAVTARSGEGVTHLARRALGVYLETHQESLLPEQKIFIEDYLKDRTAHSALNAGDTLTFSPELIKEALVASKELTSGDLQNLSKYLPLVPSLQT